MEVKAKVNPAPAGKDAKGNVIPATKGGTAAVQFSFPADFAGVVKAYGEPVVYAHAKGSIIIAVQAFMRRLIDAGKLAVEIQAEVTNWKPDVRTAVKMTALEKATGAIKSLSADERAKLLKELQAIK